MLIYLKRKVPKSNEWLLGTFLFLKLSFIFLSFLFLILLQPLSLVCH